MNTSYFGIPTLTPIPFSQEVVDLEVYDVSGKVQKLPASRYEANENENCLLKLWRLCYTWFFGKTVLQVNVENEKNPFFIKVGQAAKCLGCKEADLKTLNINDLTKKIIDHNIEQLAQMICKKRMPKNIQTSISRIKKLCSHIKYQSIYQVIEDKRFDQTRMCSTLIKIGKIFEQKKTELNETNSNYQVKIKNDKITISHSEDSLKKRKKINLHSLAYKENSYEKRIERKLLKLDSDSNLQLQQPKQLSDISSLSKIVDFARLHQFIFQPTSPFNETRLLNTLLQCSKQLKKKKFYLNSDKKKNVYSSFFVNNKLCIYKIGKEKIESVLLSTALSTSYDLIPSTLSDYLVCHLLHSYPLPLPPKTRSPFMFFSTDKRICQKSVIKWVHKQKTPAEEKLFFDSLQAIENALQQKDQSKVYFKKIGKQSAYSITCLPFAITKEKIFISLDYIDAGGYKKISLAADLADNKEYIKASAKGAKVIQKTIAEAALLEELNKKGVVHLVEPYLLTLNPAQVPKLNKLILFQKKYLGTAELFNGQYGSNIGFTKKDIVHVFKNAAECLNSMHLHGYAHLDVKISNIFLDDSETGILYGKLGDLGLSAKIDSLFDIATYEFLAPEAFSSDNVIKLQTKVSAKFDSYALGISMMQIITRSWMIQNTWCSKLDQKTIDQHLKRFKVKKPISANDKAANGLIEICNQLIQQDPNKRLSCKEAAEKLEDLYQTLFKEPVQSL